MAVVHVTLNFDDVLFPTTELHRFFHPDHNEFVLPRPYSEQLEVLDRCIHRVLSSHLDYARFRILTRAPSTWLQACWRWLPRLKRYVDWRYVSVVNYEDTTRQRQMHQLLAQDPLYTMYLFLGYSVEEDVAFPDNLRQNPALKWRVLVFVQKPTLATLLYEWDRMATIFQNFLTAKETIIRNHFVVQDDCQQQFASPGWYTNTSTAPPVKLPLTDAASVTPPKTSPGPLSPNGLFALPPPLPRPAVTSPLLTALDKTLPRTSPPVLDLSP